MPDLNPFIGLADEWDDRPDRRPETAQDIIEAARRLVQSPDRPATD